MVNNRRILISIATGVLAVAFSVLLAWLIFLRTSIVSNDQGLKYTVHPGASVKSVVHDLYVLNIIKYPRFFNAWVFLKNNKDALKAGEYLFPKGTTPVSLFNQITTGTGILYHTFTIIAGWNFKHLREALDHEPDLQHTLTSLSDTEVMARLGFPTLNPEGRFYPDTFYFVKNSSDIVLLKRSFQLMQNKLNSLWKARDLDLPYHTQQEVLTVASLIEKETALDQERPLIAGVIVNRLKKNMRLQIDPTVIYAIGDRFDGVIYKSDLMINSPYNTYVNKGLPPTPIAIPGMASIKAALHPAHHNYYYFVKKNRNSASGHQFSTTLIEHHEAVFDSRNFDAEGAYFNENLIRAYFLRSMQRAS